MKTLYLDIFSGISGDMFLGAMISLGIDLRQLERELAKLELTGYHIHAERRQNSNIEGIKFDVHLDGDHGQGQGAGSGEDHDRDHDHDLNPDPDHERGGHTHTHAHAHSHSHGHSHSHSHGAEQSHGHPHAHASDEGHGRDFGQIREMILSSALSPWIKQKAVSVFERVAVAEGKIHGQPPEQVHFHEVGAIDSIVDIVGACIALELLGKPRVLAAPVVEGTGWVQCAHGRFPVPTAATLEILGARGIPVSQCEEPNELVTPTGAALLAEFAESFAPMRNLAPTQIGYGLGTRQNKTRPNVLRAILADSFESTSEASSQQGSTARDWEIDTITVLETNLDDCHPEILGHLVDRALTAGALDLFYTSAQMKKNRPGVLLTLLCSAEDADTFSELLLRETSAFGVRRYTVERRKLRREFVQVSTPYGQLTLKMGKLNNEVLHATPEFESCKELALRSNLPLKSVYQAGEEAARALLRKS